MPDKPSIAVLPFENMSADPEQAYFADGLTEDLITDLSKVPRLFVIARNSSFAYKGRSTDIRQIARELGVKYLLEGSARRAGGRVRINVQLIDAAAGGHIWAERFDRDLADIFALQDEVIGKIVEALVGRLAATQIPKRKGPVNLEAYDLCVRARTLAGRSLQGQKEARLMLQRAIDLDPHYAEAYRWLAIDLWAGLRSGGKPDEAGLRMAVTMAERAVALDPNDADNRWVLGYLLAFERRWRESDAEFAAALALDPNNADAWAILSDLSAFSGRPEEALDQIERALRLNPQPVWWYWWLLGQAQYDLRQYDNAAKTLRREETYRTESRRTLAAALAQLGKLEEARHEAELFMIGFPHFTISSWARMQPCRDEAGRAALQHIIDGYRLAGLPD